MPYSICLPGTRDRPYPRDNSKLRANKFFEPLNSDSRVAIAVEFGTVLTA